MEITKLIPPELLRRKVNEGLTFGKKVYETFPEIEKLLNSAWKGVKDRPKITLALSEKWVGLENMEADRYAVAVVKLDWRRDEDAKPDESQPIKYANILTREFADNLIKSASGSQFKCEVIEGRNSIIGGFKLTDRQSGIIIEVTRKSILENIMADSEMISYAKFHSESLELMQLLRFDKPTGEAEQKPMDQKGPNCQSMERTIANVSTIIGRLGGEGVAETFNTMRTELETSFRTAAIRYPDRIEEILEKAWRLTDGTTYDRLMVTKCALYIVIGSDDLATGLRRLESLEKQGVKGLDVALLNPAMGGDPEAVLATIDFGTARIDIDTYIRNNGTGMRESYVQLKNAIEKMAKQL